MKIICGTDFSQHAVEAADVAAAMAVRLRERFRLVHVFETQLSELISKDQFNKLREQRRLKLKNEAARLRKAGATVEEELLEGSPSVALTGFAAKSKANLIVVSSLGRIAPSRWLVGSVAERVAQSSLVPTLIVRDGAAFKAWARRKRTLRILVGYDFSATADAALCWVSELRKIGSCKVTVASVFWPPQDENRFGLAEHSWDDSLEVQRFLERDLRRQCENILGDCDIRIRVAGSWGRPDPQLIAFAKEVEADLMVVGTHQRHGVERFWLGSVSRRILHDAPMNVACVPPSASSELGGGSIPVFQRVLVPSDFSALGNRAIPFAYSTLYRGGAVCLFHVLERTRSKARKVDRTLKKLEQQLRALIPTEAKARWISTKVEVASSGKPATAICQAAERFGADLICIGSHGRSGLSRAVLGSVAQDVMARSHLPVLVIRPPIP